MSGGNISSPSRLYGGSPAGLAQSRHCYAPRNSTSIRSTWRMGPGASRGKAPTSRGDPGAAVKAAIPIYREVDADPRWHNWLRSVDLLSGQTAGALERRDRQRCHEPGDLVLQAVPAGRPGGGSDLWPGVLVRQADLHSRADRAAVPHASKGRLCRARGRVAEGKPTSLPRGGKAECLVMTNQVNPSPREPLP